MGGSEQGVKAISTDAIFNGFSSRADGSLGFRGCTPELKPEEKTVFFGLHNQTVRLLIQPMETPEELITVAKDIEVKSPAQRLRAVLFVLWKHLQPADVLFEEFYANRMEMFIEDCKRQLPE